MTKRYDPQWIARYYDQYGEKEWARWDISPEERVKFRIHRHYLEKYVKPGQKILEIGAGSGRFTQVIVGIGARVVVADIAPKQLEWNRINAEKYGFRAGIVDWAQVDVCDLGRFGNDEFDAVVAYGGLFGYAFERRTAAMTEVLRVLRNEGPLLLSVMSTWGSVHAALESVLSVPDAENDAILASGDLHPDTFPNVNHRVHMFRAEELRRFLEEFPVSLEALSSSNSLTAGYGDRLAPIEKQEEKWNYLLEKEIEASREKGLLDIGTHIIAVARKRETP